MTNEELNRYIHEKVMGIMECSNGTPNCGCERPDYCTDLNAMAEAEAATIKAKGVDAYTEQLLHHAYQDFNGEKNTTMISRALTANALTRARAVHAAWEEK
jgi:hypothetical protein